MVIQSTITSKWQMTLPKALRKEMGIKRPGRVSLKVQTVAPARKALLIDQPPTIFELAGTFKPRKNKGVSVLKAREYFETHYGRHI